jgi:threonine dehydrogenase-like Zn-dependent dehydrogenase
MRSAVISGPREIRMETSEGRRPEPGEVLVRLEGCGLCASNLPVWEGRPWFRYPLVLGAPGHEAWGTVQELGEGVQGLEVSQRVALLSGRGFAEYEWVPRESLVPLPASLRGRPFPGEPLGCAYNVFRRSGIRFDHSVAILGIGFLGALLTSLAKSAGARVIAFSRRPFALDVAKDLGADEMIPLNGREGGVKRVMDLTEGRGCDVVIEATGHQEPLALAGELCRVRGRMVIAGYHQDGPREVDMQVWNWKGLDVINAHERDPELYLEGMGLAIEAIERGEIDPFPLYTHTFSLEQLPLAFETLRRRPEGMMKVLVKV